MSKNDTSTKMVLFFIIIINIVAKKNPSMQIRNKWILANEFPTFVRSRFEFCENSPFQSLHTKVLRRNSIIAFILRAYNSNLLLNNFCVLNTYLCSSQFRWLFACMHGVCDGPQVCMCLCVYTLCDHMIFCGFSIIR